MSDTSANEFDKSQDRPENEDRPIDPVQNEAVENEVVEEFVEDGPRANESYTAEDMQHLNDREHVRMRPSMYIGDVASQGLHHLVNEVVDNSLDEALAAAGIEVSMDQQPPEKPDGEDMTPPEINEDKADMFNLFQQFLEWLKGNNAE